MNAVLDVLGHYGAASCHLSRIVRGSKTKIGSRYTEQSCAGFITASRRSFIQSRALRCCGAKSESCPLLAFKPSQAENELVLHKLCQNNTKQRQNVPLPADGTPVVPGAFDPYRACFVGPDHLLTGHFRDCLNLAFRLLPSRDVRVNCEKYMLEILEICRLIKQNRFIDHEKESRFAMSMTELYSLSIVAHIGSENGISCSKYALPSI